MEIEVHKSEGTRYRSTLRLGRGVLIALEGGSWNRIGGPIGRVPHDLAHLVVERELGLDRGLWGVLAAGGLVKNATHVGRRPQHGATRAKAVIDAAGEQLRQAEVLVRAVADASVAGRFDEPSLRRAITDRYWHPRLTAEAFMAMDAGLQEFAREWRDVGPGSALRCVWGDERP